MLAFEARPASFPESIFLDRIKSRYNTGLLILPGVSHEVSPFKTFDGASIIKLPSLLHTSEKCLHLDFIDQKRQLMNKRRCFRFFAIALIRNISYK
jgi:hypothetical protein